MTTQETWQQHGARASDHDREYVFGNPDAGLSWHDRCQLLILRIRVRDAQHGEAGGPGDGDLSYVMYTPSGLVVPDPLSRAWRDDEP